MASDSDVSGLSLTEMDSRRSPEEKQRDGKSGDTLYRLNYRKNNCTVSKSGKVTEIDVLAESGKPGLQQLADEGYTHYGILRLEDRSTTVFVQDKSGTVYKTFTLGRNTVKVPHEVIIEEASQD